MNENQVFNHNFIYPNDMVNFPAGWQIFKGHNTASFYWELDSKQNYRVGIKNKKNTPASICQEPFYNIPVYEKQVWEIGAMLKVNHKSWATIRVHFTSRSFSRPLSISLDFLLEPICHNYSGIITIPQGADYAMLEIGIEEAGCMWIEDVNFKRVFPIEKYDMDARGRLNINNVESVTRILEPVDVNGTFELVKPNKDFVEDVKADTIKRHSTIQDVFNLSTYSFCVINEGTNEAVVQMQLSPNGINWAEDPIADDHIDSGQLKILVYNRFARYVRLKYWTDNGITKLRIYFQGQG